MVPETDSRTQVNIYKMYTLPTTHTKVSLHCAFENNLQGKDAFILGCSICREGFRTQFGGRHVVEHEMAGLSVKVDYLA